MNNLNLLGLISTTLVVALGVSLVAPTFFSRAEDLYIQKQTIMLSFNINEERVNSPYNNSLSPWCQELAAILENYKIRATIFIAGNVAENNPECVKIFSSNNQLDIGSTTYSYASLLSIEDYTQQLEEVKRGKQEIDEAGNISSLAFKAPYGETNDDIYSLLNRSDIRADFSYDDHYNKYYDGYFIWFNITSFEAKNYQPELLRGSKVTEIPIVFNFDQDSNPDQIRDFISNLNMVASDKIRFANASDLVGSELTIRRSDET